MTFPLTLWRVNNRRNVDLPFVGHAKLGYNPTPCRGCTGITHNKCAVDTAV